MIVAAIVVPSLVILIVQVSAFPLTLHTHEIMNGVMRFVNDLTVNII